MNCPSQSASNERIDEGNSKRSGGTFDWGHHRRNHTDLWIRCALSLLVLLSNAFAPCFCLAQEAPPTDIAVEAQDASATTGIEDTFSDVLNGDFTGLSAMLERYLVPALTSLILIAFAYIAATSIGRVVGSTVSSRIDVTLGRFVSKLVSNGILLFAFLGVLGKFGVDVTSFAAVIAASGFAVGMAMQGALANFAAGVMLLIFRPFKVGDVINVGGQSGSVHEIDLFTTRLNTLDNRHLILPNGEVFGSTIENVTHNRIRRVDVAVGVSYSADLRQTRKVLEGAVAVVPGAVTDPAPTIVLCNLGDSAVDWQLRVWTRPENYFAVHEYVTGAAKEALDAANISIPFPQMDVHVLNNMGQAKAG